MAHSSNTCSSLEPNRVSSVWILQTNSVVAAIGKQISPCRISTNCNERCFIAVQESANIGIVISTLQVIHPNFIVIVITTIAVGVDGCNVAGRGVGNNGANAPDIVGILCNHICLIIQNSYNIALQILVEVEILAVEADTADGLLIVVQRNQHILAPGFPEDLGTIQHILMPDTIDSLAGTDTVGIVGIGNAVKRLELAALFPGQGMAEVRGGVALCVVDNSLLAGTVSVYSNFALLSN